MTRPGLFVEVDAVRPWLLQRVALVVVAFDCWLTHLRHAGRYGFGEFNVAHFGWLDALQPTPTPATYIAVVTFAGLLALVQALVRPTRLGVGLACAAYTYGWSMSLLDSYQHHYLLSIVLLWLALFPRLTSADVFGGAARADGLASPRPRARLVGGAVLALGIVDGLMAGTGAPSLLGQLGPGAGLPVPPSHWLVRATVVVAGAALVVVGNRASTRAASAAAAGGATDGAVGDHDPRDRNAAVADDAPDEPAPAAAPSGRNARKARRAAARGAGRIDAQPPAALAATLATEASDAPADADRSAPRTVAWAYVLLTANIAIVYAFTALNKLGSDWRAGHALKNIGQTPLLRGAVELLTVDGLPLLGRMPEQVFWERFAAATILVQVVAAAGFLLAPQQEALPRRWRWPVRLLGVAPLSFHLLAEVGLTLSIGWFSYYMMAFCCVVFAPAAWLRTLTEGGTAPLRWLAATARAPLPIAALALAGGSACLWAAGRQADLPGAAAGTALASLAVLVDSVVASARRAGGGVPAARAWGGEIGARGVAALLAAAALAVSMAQSEVRFDYYRYLGGEHRRHGEPDASAAAYAKANAHLRWPFCLDDGAELVQCYADEATAQTMAARFGMSVRSRERRVD